MRNWTTPAPRWPAVLGAMLTLGVSIAIAGPASAMTTLDVELDTGLSGTFATVDIVENAGALDFTIQLDPSLGPNADIREFYFNILDADITGVGITTNDSVQANYSLESDPAVTGGAGSGFDYGVNFGNGAGPPGNGALNFASFTVFADQSLSLAQLQQISHAKGGMIDLHLALHVQGTSLLPGATSETVGGMIVVPEPSAGLLLSIAMTGWGIQSRRTRQADAA